MKSRFVGYLDFGPETPAEKDRWVLEQPYGFLYKERFFIVTMPGNELNGASYPKMLWRRFGHPFQSGNKFWMTPHDGGYNGFDIVYDMKHVNMTPEGLLKSLPATGRIDVSKLPRRFFDKVLYEAMKVCDEKFKKRVITYVGIKIGGFFAWRNDEEVRIANISRYAICNTL